MYVTCDQRQKAFAPAASDRMHAASHSQGGLAIEEVRPVRETHSDPHTPQHSMAISTSWSSNFLESKSMSSKSVHFS